MSNPISIVMIDENIRDQDIFSIALNGLNIDYHCKFSKTVEQAIKHLRKQPPDFIFVDASALDGIACFKRIRRIKMLKKIPLIAYADDKEIHQDILDNGADICLTKTLQTSELILMLKKILIRNNESNKEPINV